MAGRPRPTGDARQRAAAASELLNSLGGLAQVEEQNGTLMIRSDGCPLAAATKRYPEACNAMESLLSEFTGLRVTQVLRPRGAAALLLRVGLSPT